MNCITPVNARVFLRLLPEEDRAGSIVLPERHRPRAQRGVVLAAGPGREYPTTGRRIPPGVVPGDVVVFNRYAEERAVGGKHAWQWDGVAVVSQEEILLVLDGLAPCAQHDHARCLAESGGLVHDCGGVVGQYHPCAEGSAKHHAPVRCDGSGTLERARLDPELVRHLRRTVAARVRQ